ncbi:MAG: hypothetical protein JW984_03725 [Deltaproteobacteria bacterium]|uniref:Uncharacterized protein n=1 Tax=Candidatus Zymogenus saltonus TaxID=2844893 RepID=A0A9D8KB41_9DELT|nr:hypothetical protein [Candidatus Zymogenus saltonus]
MRNRTAVFSTVAVVSGFAVSILGAFLMTRAEALQKIVAGLVIAVGVISVFVGVVLYTITSIIYMVSKQPKYETGAAVEGEYYSLMESGEIEEVPVRFPARRTLSGGIDRVPLTIRLYFTPTGRYTASRTEFFSPFEGGGGRKKMFRLYPTGQEVRSDLGVGERFARAFYVPKSDYEAFKASGLSAEAMGALLDFQDENGGVLSMDRRGLFWSIGQLDLGGLGSDIARQFIETFRVVSDSLERVDGSEVGDTESVPEELVFNPNKRIGGSSQPTYATRRTLVGIVAALLLIGGFCLIGAVVTYGGGGDRETFITLTAVSAFTLTPGVVMLPILIYHLVTSRPASKP